MMDRRAAGPVRQMDAEDLRVGGGAGVQRVEELRRL